MTQSNQQPQVDPSTLSASYELAIKSLDSSSREASSVDTKLIGTFAVSIIVVGLLPIVPEEPGLTVWNYWPNWFLYLGIAAFVWVSIWVYQGFRSRRFNSVGTVSPKLIREYYWDFSKDTFKIEIYEWVQEAWEENRRNLHSKSYAFVRTLPATALEIIFLLAWIFTREAFPISS